MKLRYKGGLPVGSGLTLESEYSVLGTFPLPGPNPAVLVVIWVEDSKKWTICPLDVFEPSDVKSSIVLSK